MTEKKKTTTIATNNSWFVVVSYMYKSETDDPCSHQNSMGTTDAELTPQPTTVGS